MTQAPHARRFLSNSLPPISKFLFHFLLVVMLFPKAVEANDNRSEDQRHAGPCECPYIFVWAVQNEWTCMHFDCLGGRRGRSENVDVHNMEVGLRQRRGNFGRLC